MARVAYPVENGAYTVAGGARQHSVEALQHEYDAQALTGFSSGDPVSTIGDQAGDNDLTMGGGTYQESLINGHPGVFIAENDSFEADVAETGSGSEYTVACVFQLPSSGPYTVFSNGHEGGSDNGYHFTSGSTEWNYTVSGVANNSWGSIDTDPHILVASYDGSTLEIDFDGSNVFTDTQGLTDPSGTMYLGERIEFSSNLSDIDFGYLAFWDEYKNASERGTIHDDLDAAWAPVVTVHDDFESYTDTADMRSTWDDYGNDTYDLATTDAPEGSQAAISNGTHVRMSRTDLTTTEGEAWSVLVQFTDSTATTLGFFTHAQGQTGSTVFDDQVWCRLDLQDDELDLFVRENSGTNDNTSAATSESLSIDTPYMLEVETDVATTTAEAWAYTVDTNGDPDTEIANATVTYDTGYSGGDPGFYAQDAALGTIDYLRQRPSQM